MGLKRLLFLGAIAGGVVAVLKGRDAQGQDSGAGGERYEPPVEAGSQPPREPGGPPSDAAPVRDASSVASEPGDQLQTPAHDAPGDAVMPDTSADDPLVREQEKAAAADAGAVGGNVDQMAADEPGFPEDPEMRPVVEGSGDAEEAFEARDEELGGNRQADA